MDRKLEIALWKSLDDNVKNALKTISKLSDKLKYKIATNWLLKHPNGINYPPRFFQPIDHNGIKGICYFMDIDGVVLVGNIACYLEAKTRNKTNSFDNWFSDESNGHRRKQLYHLIDCNTKTFDMIVYCTHDIPENECIPLDKLIVEKVYMKDNLDDEKGHWVDTYDNYSYLDLLIYLSKNKR